MEEKELCVYYQSIREKWRNRLTGNTIEDTSDEVYQKMMDTLTKEAQELWDSMNKGGNDREYIWSDIAFVYRWQNTMNNVTEVLGRGFARIETLATAYNAKGSALYHNPELKKDIIDVLEWVYATMYNDKEDMKTWIYGNWWHWYIGIPRSLCNSLVLMYDELDSDLIQREAMTLEKYNENPHYRYIPLSGIKSENLAGNLIDTALVATLRAVIGENAHPLEMAKEALSSCLGYVTSGNGYYEDGSYIDHGDLAYTGGYGAVLLGGMEKILFLIDGTPWSIETEKLDTIFAWIYNGIRPLFVDGAAMDMASGRGVSRPKSSDHSIGCSLLRPISHLVEIAPESLREKLRSFAKTEIQGAIQYNKDYFVGMTVADMTAMKKLLLNTSVPEDNEIYHKNFGAMDKAVYHGENFDLGISMYSSRTGNFEYGNRENRKGWHQSDGVVYLYNGDQAQYANVYWPTIDEHRLAGITTDHTEGGSEEWKTHNSSKDWVGGSSVLKKFGSVGMDFEAELPNAQSSTLVAKKSWFTFPNAVVALGAGIQSNEGKETETIVENRKVRDDASNAVWTDGEKLELTLNESVSVVANWILLEGNHGEEQNLAYYFPEKTEIQVIKETRVGNWKEINGSVTDGSQYDAEIEKNYISLAIQHGVNPQNEDYSYVLLPGRTIEEMKAYTAQPEIKILANTSEVQAVENTRYGVCGYNFWSAGKAEKFDVSAETPASVTTAKEEGCLTVGISNPTQNGQDTIVILHHAYRALEVEEGVTVSNQDGNTVIQITGSKDFGKTYTVVLQDIVK